jgi:DNA-binding transcriptional regulator YdaS (Cro superfamily)
MNAAQLKRELRRIAYGQSRLAEKLGVNPSEVRHWLAGDDPVPHMVALDIRNLPTHTAAAPAPVRTARRRA